MRTLHERFRNKVRRGPGGCIIWCAAHNQDGYGRMRVNGVLRPAHHVSWFLTYGVWPEYLLHTCDTPACVRPSHLREATHRENMDDKIAKGRQTKGDQISSSKLTVEDVREIRRMCAEEILSYPEIGEIFDIAPANVWVINSRRSWGWLDPDEPIRRKLTKGRDVRDLASRSGVTTKAIRYRIAKGLTGDALLAPRHRAPRKPYTKNK